MSVVHLICPFPPCTAEWWTGVGPAQTGFEIPFHLPQGFEGAAHYDLRCPGALIVVRGEGPNPKAMSHPDNERINRAYNHLVKRRAAERERAEQEAAAERDKPGPYLGGPIGRPVDPDTPREMWFPGRPADAPEPGPGEHAPPLPAGVEGTSLTGRDSMSDRQALKALALVAANQLGQLAGVLDRIAGELTAAQGLAVAAEHQVHSAQVLVNRAVGTGAGAPQSAQLLAEYTALTTDILAGPQGSVPASLALALNRVETARTQARLAEQNGRAYAAIP